MPRKTAGKEGERNDDTGHMRLIIWAVFIHHGRGGHLAPDRNPESLDEEPVTDPDDESTSTSPAPSVQGERIFPTRRAQVEPEYWRCPDVQCTHRALGDDTGPFEDECCPFHPDQALKRAE
ncbi:hypothetical protein [Streptomyces collinus]|uniref:hypothetical protein n=1 Tax=Streptomyces collinus TaxID=42684 RepID=UPI00331C0EC2